MIFNLIQQMRVLYFTICQASLSMGTYTVLSNNKIVTNSKTP